MKRNRATHRTPDPHPAQITQPADPIPTTANPPVVSCMMTVRNAEETLPRTLASLAAQRGVVWELVVVNDGSTDGTVQILEAFAREWAGDHPDGILGDQPGDQPDPHPGRSVRILPTEGIGRGPALNMAWSACTGTFIANLDADDLFHPDKLALQARVLLANPPISFLATESLYLGADDQPDWGVFDGLDAPDALESPDALPLRDITALLGRFNPVNHSSVVMRRDALAALGGYDAHRRRQLDYELWIRAAANGYRIYTLDVPLSAKRLHAGQSFEARPSLRYVCSSFVLQTRAISALRLPIRNYLWAAVRVLYRLAPAPIRRFVAGRKQRLLSSATSPTSSTHS